MCVVGACTHTRTHTHTRARANREGGREGHSVTHRKSQRGADRSGLSQNIIQLPVNIASPYYVCISLERWLVCLVVVCPCVCD